jgi:outer membrane murein-binding lipoprotein Lpp
LRPRTWASHFKLVEDVSEKLERLSSRVQALTADVERLSVRERQLRAVLQAEAEFEEQAARVHAILADHDAVANHVRRSIARASVHTSPFPYCVIDKLLPRDYYAALVKALPPADLFADRATNKQQLTVPFKLAPRLSHLMWNHLAGVVASTVIAPAVVEKFRVPLTAWLRDRLPPLGECPLEAIEMRCSDGRILLRRPGYLIPPHRDPKWGFITCLMYLARPSDDARWGTQLFTVLDDEDARGASPHWISEEQCRLVADVEFLPNRALVFMNSAGAHGAQIPANAQPPTLERYAYQFRVGPSLDSIDDIQSRLSDQERPMWAGKGTEY